MSVSASSSASQQKICFIEVKTFKTQNFEIVDNRKEIVYKGVLDRDTPMLAFERALRQGGELHQYQHKLETGELTMRKVETVVERVFLPIDVNAFPGINEVKEPFEHLFSLIGEADLPKLEQISKVFFEAKKALQGIKTDFDLVKDVDQVISQIVTGLEFIKSRKKSMQLMLLLKQASNQGTL